MRVAVNAELVYMYCSVLRCVACVAVSCSVLRCVAVCCGVHVYRSLLTHLHRSLLQDSFNVYRSDTLAQETLLQLSFHVYIGLF